MDKLSKLKANLRELDSIIVAFSGGLDSSFLLKVAKDILPKDNILAVTALSDTYTKSELNQAKKFSSALGVNHKVIKTDELKDPRFTKNPRNRCYYCKKELFGRLNHLAKQYGFYNVVDASNLDDKNDYRPGSKAKNEFGVRSPLQEANFTKRDIRKFSKKLGLDTWNMPQMACLASRIPYGEKIERSILKRIEKGEEFIKALGVKQVRIRCHNNTARIEVEKKDIKRFSNRAFCDKIIRYLKSMRFSYVALDLEGYRTGSLNESLKQEVLRLTK